ncbi:FecR family protein [Mucilaginibacter sp. FT3.2]|uniref:FecR family protein n=1 Tax=Mucilaginibacter sp. FT3.2 TaxID=2723090 RepID=UPI001607C0B4|nr:FecR domain-containing protein [Mucilaginibacter sp. FT3.2]MBB6233619.1 ferric-dicitrate binding protein FerR (iron transport regulator) [Mucilaginibacter sp. FT3.2]
MKKYDANNKGNDERDMLSRYLNGTCTEDERALVEQWYNIKASEKGSLPDNLDLKKDKQEIWNKISKQEAIIRPLSYKLAGIAASVILLLAVGIALFNRGTFKYSTSLAWVQVAAPKGKVIKVALPDGSAVWLNAGSTLAYSAEFGQGIRMVKLTDGEAYFDVVHDPHKPFIVITGNLRTQVLGTSFNIRAGAEMKNITVTVSGGKVAVIKKGAAPIFLLPDEQADFNKATEEIDKSTVAAQNATGWLSGKFRFHNEALEAITSELQRRFNVSFTFETDDLRNIRFNTGFNTDDRLTDILDDLAKTGNIRYRIHESQVTISPAIIHKHK